MILLLVVVSWLFVAATVVAALERDWATLVGLGLLLGFLLTIPFGERRR